MGLFKKDEPSISVSTPDLSQQFAEVQQRNEIAEVLRELFQEKKIFMISDATKSEIKLATRIHMIAKMKKLALWEDGLYFYFMFMLSKERKSRKELLEAMKGNISQSTMLQKINPFAMRR